MSCEVQYQGYIVTRLSGIFQQQDDKIYVFIRLKD